MSDGNKPATRPLNSRTLGFCQLVANGKLQWEAWKAFWGPNAKPKTAREKASRLMADPRVQAEIARLQAKTEAHVLLSVNDRLHLLSKAARQEVKTPADRGALARVLTVYNQLAGDAAPERHEVSGPAGAPIPVAATVAATVAIQRVPIRARVEALKARRA